MKQKTVQSRPYRNFVDSIQSENTKYAYVKALEEFLKYAEVPSYDAIIYADTKTLQEKVIDHIQDLKKRGLSWQTMRVRVAGIRHFCVMNDVVLNWPKIYKFIGEKKRTVQDRIYTKEELRLIYEKCDERKRAILLLLVSTGMRIGAFPTLKIKHLEKLEEYGLYRIKVYAGSSSEYVTFCSPETAQVLDSYLAFRRQKGEIINPDSPLFREQFADEDANNVKPLEYHGFVKLIVTALVDAGLRKNEHDRHKRKDVMRFHGFRKYFNTMLNQAGVKPVTSELLMGHDTGLNESYLRPTEKELVTEYLKAVELISISEEKQLRHEVAKLKTDVADIDLMKKNYLDMRLVAEEKDKKLSLVSTELDNAVKVIRGLVSVVSATSEEGKKKALQDLIDSGYTPKTS
jgi:integrase